MVFITAYWKRENDDRFSIISLRFAVDIRKVMDDKSIIALDNGIYKLWFAHNYKAYQPNTVLLGNALASIWAGLLSVIIAQSFAQKKFLI